MKPAHAVAVIARIDETGERRLAVSERDGPSHAPIASRLDASQEVIVMEPSLRADRLRRRSPKWNRVKRCTTLRYISSQPIRIESETLDALRERSAQSGEPIVRLAQRYIEEGMRVDRHPGIVFRDGPAGRRGVVVGGPDIWEVVAAARSAPERGEELIGALAERIGVPGERIRIAVRYYAEYPDDVDRFIATVEEEAEQLEQTLERERRILG